jgi:hypothetical protein
MTLQHSKISLRGAELSLQGGELPLCCAALSFYPALTQAELLTSLREQAAACSPMREPGCLSQNTCF